MSTFQQNFESLYGHLKTAQALNTLKEVAEPNNTSVNGPSLLRIISIAVIAGVATWIIYDLVKQNRERREVDRI